jgi:hypothetical protein
MVDRPSSSLCTSIQQEYKNEKKPQKPNSISPIITKTTNPILMMILDFSLLLLYSHHHQPPHKKNDHTLVFNTPP